MNYEAMTNEELEKLIAERVEEATQSGLLNQLRDLGRILGYDKPTRRFRYGTRVELDCLAIDTSDGPDMGALVIVSLKNDNGTWEVVADCRLPDPYTETSYSSYIIPGPWMEQVAPLHAEALRQEQERKADAAAQAHAERRAVLMSMVQAQPA